MGFSESSNNEQQYAAYDSERADRGHNTEEVIFSAMGELGYRELDHSSLGKDPGVDHAFVRADSTEDWEHGFDLHVWNGELKTWIRTDITVDTSARHQLKEESRPSVDGVLAVDKDYIDLLQHDARDARHSDGLDIVSDKLGQMFNRFRDKQRKKARS